jgi:membrane associated rhomboid family serine protease
VILFLAKEIFSSFAQNNIAEFAHIAGGIIGSLFGFFSLPGEQPPARLQ